MMRFIHESLLMDFTELEKLMALHGQVHVSRLQNPKVQLYSPSYFEIHPTSMVQFTFRQSTTLIMKKGFSTFSTEQKAQR